MNKKVCSFFMAAVMLVSLLIPAFAVDVSTDGGTGSVPVELTAAAATFSVTVPTSLPINVDAAGVVTAASDAKIVNNSHGSVKVTNMTISASEGWTTVDFASANMSAEKVGSKKVAMQINGDSTTGANTISFTESNFPKMDGVNASNSDELPITYTAKVPAQATALNNVSVVSVVFTVNWDT